MRSVLVFIAAFLCGALLYHRQKRTQTMPAPLPALNLIAQPGRRRDTLDTAREIERRGFAEIQISSSFSNMSQCVGLALGTGTIPFATAIARIYARRSTISRIAPPISTRSPAGGSASASASRTARPMCGWG